MSTIYTANNEYWVVLELLPEFQRDLSALDMLYVRGKTGKLVPLSSVRISTFEPRISALLLRRKPSPARISTWPATDSTSTLMPVALVATYAGKVKPVADVPAPPEGWLFVPRRNGAGLGIDRQDAGGATSGEGGIEVVDGEAEMMDAGAAFLDELGDGRAVHRRFKQFDQGVTGGVAGDSCAIGIGEWGVGQAEQVMQQRPECVVGPDGEADVGDRGPAASRCGSWADRPGRTRPWRGWRGGSIARWWACGRFACRADGFGWSAPNRLIFRAMRPGGWMCAAPASRAANTVSST